MVESPKPLRRLDQWKRPDCYVSFVYPSGNRDARKSCHGHDRHIAAFAFEAPL